MVCLFLVHVLNLNILVFDLSFAFKPDVITLYYYIVTIMLLVTVLFFVSLFLSNSLLYKNVINKKMSYECGFSPIYSDVRNRFYLPYFRISLLFLIFDLEVLYFIPFLLISKFFFLSGLYFLFYKIIPVVFIIFIGVIYEYISGTIDWIS